MWYLLALTRPNDELGGIGKVAARNVGWRIRLCPCDNIKNLISHFNLQNLMIELLNFECCNVSITSHIFINFFIFFLFLNVVIRCFNKHYHVSNYHKPLIIRAFLMSCFECNKKCHPSYWH